jgi:hypothetical protein
MREAFPAVGQKISHDERISNKNTDNNEGPFVCRIERNLKEREVLETTIFEWKTTGMTDLRIP